MPITSSLQGSSTLRYAQARAQQATQFDIGMKKLTTSEKGILGRIFDAVCVFFEMKGTSGSVAELKYCLNQLKQHVITQKKNNLTLSHTDAPLVAFKEALTTRAVLLANPDRMIIPYAGQPYAKMHWVKHLMIKRWMRSLKRFSQWISRVTPRQLK